MAVRLVRNPTILFVIASAAFSAAVPAAADDVTGETEILCSTFRVKE